MIIREVSSVCTHVCLCVCIHVCSCVYVHTCMFVCVCACVNVCGAQKTTLPVIPQVLPPCWLRQGLSLAYNRQAGKADWPVSLRGLPVSISPFLGLQVWTPSSGFFICVLGFELRTRALLTELCPRVQEALLEASGQLLRSRVAPASSVL